MKGIQFGCAGRGGSFGEPYRREGRRGWGVLSGQSYMKKGAHPVGREGKRKTGKLKSARQEQGQHSVKHQPNPRRGTDIFLMAERTKKK